MRHEDDLEFDDAMEANSARMRTVWENAEKKAQELAAWKTETVALTEERQKATLTLGRLGSRIHTFRDGNGSIFRLMALWALARHHLSWAFCLVPQFTYGEDGNAPPAS